MALVTIDELTQHAYNAGYRGLELPAIVAIAIAEGSKVRDNTGNIIGVDTQSHNPGTTAVPENSWGPLQINLAAHPQYTTEQVTNPAEAFKIAFEDFPHTFRDWTTYTNGSSASYLGLAADSVKRITGPTSGVQSQPFATVGSSMSQPTSGGDIVPVSLPIGNPLNLVPDVGGVGGAIKDAFSPITDLIKWLMRPEHWWRIFFIGSGGALIIVGLGIYLRDSVGDMASMTPQGAALKAVA